MTIDQNALDALRPEPKRDQWGRYKIIPAAGGKAVGHSRVTTFAKAIAETHNLTEWAKRNVALGMAKRPDLVAMAHGLTHADKAAMKEVVDAADEASGANEARRMGTALHSMAERVDLGLATLDDIPEAQRADVAAYVAEMKRCGIEVVPEYVERVCVIPQFTLAGTFDRLVMIDGELHVADLKTGKEISYGAGEIAMQLALYAHAETLYDTAAEVHSPMPAVNQSRAVIIHLPLGQARCELTYVDIEAGWESCRLAAEVRAWRKRRDLLIPLSSKITGTAPTATIGVVDSPTDSGGDAGSITAGRAGSSPERHAWVRGRVVECVNHSAGAKSDIGALWPEGVPTFRQIKDGALNAHPDDELEQIIAVLNEVEKRHEIPFGANDPDTVAEVRTVPRGRPDEGADIAPELVKELKVLIGGLDAAAKTALDQWAEQASAAERTFSLKSKASERRYAIVSAAITLARWDPTDIACREVLSLVMGEEVQPTVTVGQALGSLTTDEATRLTNTVVALLENSTITFDSSGTPSLVA